MIKILFVCHGNICRSVMAEYIMQHLAAQAGVAQRWQIDSAATSREEIGNPIYPEARRMLESRGVPVGSHRARQLCAADYAAFDLLIAMDRANLRNMQRICGGDPEDKLRLLLDYTDRPGEVADPWYTRDFTAAYRDVLAGCHALLERYGE